LQRLSATFKLSLKLHLQEEGECAVAQVHTTRGGL